MAIHTLESVSRLGEKGSLPSEGLYEEKLVLRRVKRYDAFPPPLETLPKRCDAFPPPVESLTKRYNAFPPPLESPTVCDGNYGHMGRVERVCFKSIRRDGRLILEEKPQPLYPQRFITSHRCDGRLQLHLYTDTLLQKQDAPLVETSSFPQSQLHPPFDIVHQHLLPLAVSLFTLQDTHNPLAGPSLSLQDSHNPLASPSLSLQDSHNPLAEDFIFRRPCKYPAPCKYSHQRRYPHQSCLSSPKQDRHKPIAPTTALLPLHPPAPRFSCARERRDQVAQTALSAVEHRKQIGSTAENSSPQQCQHSPKAVFSREENPFAEGARRENPYAETARKENRCHTENARKKKDPKAEKARRRSLREGKAKTENGSAGKAKQKASKYTHGEKEAGEREEEREGYERDTKEEARVLECVVFSGLSFLSNSLITRARPLSMLNL